MKAINLISLFICGLALGWLIGLSTSPVIQTVIGSLLAILTTLLTLVLGIENSSINENIKNKLGNVNVFPLALFLSGLAIASSIGIYARTNEWFGINPISFKKKWEIKDTDSTGTIKNLYESIYGKEKLSNTDKNPYSPNLFNISVGMKEELRSSKTVEDIKTVLEDISAKTNNSELNREINKCTDSLCIVKIKIQILNY